MNQPTDNDAPIHYPTGSLPGWHQTRTATGGWRRMLFRLGHLRAVALITAASVLLSLSMTAVVNIVLDNVTYLTIDLLIAFAVPMLIAPLASYPAVGLLFEVEQARAQLQIAVCRDSLTGLYNRGFFLACMQDEIDQARAQGTPLALILMDVDHFKQINDSLGHAAGDRVLTGLAVLLSEILPRDCLLARFGGEEFVLLLPGATAVIAEETANRIRDALATGGCGQLPALGDMSVTASMGITCLGGVEDNADEFLARADKAMYAAKNTGRNSSQLLLPDTLT